MEEGKNIVKQRTGEKQDRRREEDRLWSDKRQTESALK